MPTELRVTVQSLDGVVDVAVAGEIDIVTADRFNRALRDAVLQASKVVAIDMSAVSFMGSAGIGVIVRAQTLADDRGVTLRLARASREVERVLELLGMFDDLRTPPSHPDPTADSS